MSEKLEKIKTLVTMSLNESQAERLQDQCDLIFAGWGKTGCRLSEEALISTLGNASILLVGYENITSRVIERAENLKLIACSRSNPVNVNVEAATSRGIPVIHTPGRNATAAAELTLGLMLVEARNIARGDQSLRSGHYLASPSDSFVGTDPANDITWDLDGESPYKQLRGVELYGRTLGLIGLGNVATKVAQLAKVFGMRVLVHTPWTDAKLIRRLGIQMVELDELLRESDFISVHCKVSDETIGLLDHRAFSLMKPTSYLINTARAAVIDQQALLDALNNHQIAGAALDVFWYEPLPSNHPLLKMKNVTLTPHIGGSTIDVLVLHSRMIVDDVLLWLDGKRPNHIFNPDVWNKHF
jgi:D-3-phosphoglycerate dehydrogenase / 2-oxoglutarate reductase